MKKNNIKLHRLSAITTTGLNNAIPAESQNDPRSHAHQILIEAQAYWLAMSKFREDRLRNKNYTYGRQWDDIVCVDGRPVKEADLIKRQGNIPLKNNLIRRIIRNVLGVFRAQHSEPTCTARDRDEQQYGETMSTVLQCNMKLNSMETLNARTMEEFLISGMAVHRKSYGWRRDRLDCWTDYVQPNNFFIDSNMRDFRGWDVSCLGEIHDIPFQTLASEFAASPTDVARLGQIYANSSDRSWLASSWEEFGSPHVISDFLVPEDPRLCRVIEIWRKESKPRFRCHDLNNGDVFKIETNDYQQIVADENERRLLTGLELGIPKDEIPLIRAEWFIDSFWNYYFLTPTAEILSQGETPYAHKSHPYVFALYPFIDGEIHSFVSDVIDQQRYVNRLITMYDWIMRASAKGVLLFPEDCLPEGMSMDDIADEWSRFNGVIMIKANRMGQLPQQVANNCTQVGIHELLSMELKLFEDISGVNGALQGKPGFSGMSASLYSQQTQNATTSLLDILDSFSAFLCEGAMKDVKNIQQFYDSPRVFNIAGKGASTIQYDPRRLRNVEFDLAVTESTATPAYRTLANEFLLEIWKSGQITVEQLLEHGDFPFADNLLQSIKTQRQTLENGQNPQSLDPSALNQATRLADPQAVEQAQLLLKDPR